MSVHFVTLAPDGTVWRCGRGAEVPSGALRVVIAPDPAWVAGVGEIGVMDAAQLGELARMRQVGDRLEARASSPLPSLSAPGTVTVGPLPSGSQIEVFDLDGSELMGVIDVAIEDDTRTLTFTVPGRYRIEVAAPIPALPVEWEVEIA